jgi:hypothetical protein
MTTKELKEAVAWLLRERAISVLEGVADCEELRPSLQLGGLESALRREARWEVTPEAEAAGVAEWAVQQAEWESAVGSMMRAELRALLGGLGVEVRLRRLLASALVPQELRDYARQQYRRSRVALSAGADARSVRWTLLFLVLTVESAIDWELAHYAPESFEDDRSDEDGGYAGFEGDSAYRAGEWGVQYSAGRPRF